MADKISYRDEIATEIIARIEAGTAPWMKPWRAGTIGVGPFNPISNKPYRGINDLWLSLQGRSDPRWMTYNQAMEKGAQVLKGERSTTIEYWQWSERVALKDADGKSVLDADGKPTYQNVQLSRPRVFYAKVFNGEQISGLAPFVAPKPAFDPIERAEALITGGGVPVFHDQNNRAFYSPARDEIHLPPLAAFDNQAGYYATVLHELGHATGHQSRLGREGGPFGSELYAREELRAEIASYMLARDLGISFDPSDHAAYVESWLKALAEDKHEIFRAAKDAETIKAWVMEPERRPALEQAAQHRNAAEQAPTEAPVVEQVPPLQQSRIYLDVPFDEKADAKRQGARWDSNVKSWYAPKNLDIALFERWHKPGHNVPQQAAQQRVIAEAVQEPSAPVRSYLDVSDAVKEKGALWDKEAQSWYVPEVPDAAPSVEPASTQHQQASHSPRTYIAVSFAEKDEAKALGAKWDRGEKSWYIPEGMDAAPFAKWAAGRQTPEPTISPEHEFAEALKTNGLIVTNPVMDGQWHRCQVVGDKGKEMNGSYRAFLNGRPSAQITNFKAGGTVQWVATGMTLSDEDRARLQAEHAQVRAERAAKQLELAEKAAKVAYGVWQNLPAIATPDNCPYLTAKGVNAHGVKVDEHGRMVIPCRDAAGRLWNIQSVDPAGKRFLENSRKQGTMHVVDVSGKGTLDSLIASPGAIVIAEGYATAATIFEATSRPVVVAFDSGNLAAVAEAVRAKFPDRALLIAADNDHANQHGNVGMLKAEAAAQAVGAKWIAPDLTAQEKAGGLTDFNDLAASRGKKAVHDAIEAVLASARQRQPVADRAMAI